MPAKANLMEVIRLIGNKAVMALVTAYGGVNLDIPASKRGRTYKVIAEQIGCEAASELVKHYSGTRLYIPACHAYKCAQRNQKIVAAYDAGDSVKALARRFSLSERHIYTILKTALPFELDQGGMFACLGGNSEGGAE